MESAWQPDEIAALCEKARTRTSAVRRPADAAAATRFDPRRSGQLSETQLRGLEALHKACAFRLAESLGARLRVAAEVDVAAVSEPSPAEFLDRLPGPAYLVSFRSSLGGSGLLHLDPLLVFPLLELLLGGAGGEAGEARDLTEIEQEVLAPLAASVLGCLEEVWHPLLKVDFDLDRASNKGEALGLFPPTDRLLLASFQLRFEQVQGGLLVAFPSALSAALLRKLAPQEAPPQPAAPADRGRLRERLLDGRFLAELLLPPCQVPVRELYLLQPGKVLPLSVPANEPLVVRTAGRDRFLAAPVRLGSRRGAEVIEVVPIRPDRIPEGGSSCP